MIFEQQLVDAFSQAVSAGATGLDRSSLAVLSSSILAPLQVGSNGNEQHRQVQLEGLYEQLFTLVAAYHQQAMQTFGLFVHDDGVAITITKVREDSTKIDPPMAPRLPQSLHPLPV